MSDEVTVKILGLAELQKTLEEMPREVARKVIRTSLNDAANELRDVMVNKSPRDTGFLSQHFNVKVRVKGDELAATAFIGPAGKMYYPNVGSRERGVATGKHAKKGGAVPVASVARFLEFGTSKMSAKPFMRPAFESTKDSGLAKIIDGIRTAIAKWVR